MIKAEEARKLRDAAIEETTFPGIENVVKEACKHSKSQVKITLPKGAISAITSRLEGLGYEVKRVPYDDEKETLDSENVVPFQIIW